LRLRKRKQSGGCVSRRESVQESVPVELYESLKLSMRAYLRKLLEVTAARIRKTRM
jgi:hypothetical protein